jgi:phosphoribosylpyrophosphate synthetase
MPDFVVGREDFSRRLAEELGCKYRAFRHEYHPDGEPAHRILAEYDELDGKHVVLVLRGSQLPDYTRVSRNLHNFSRHVDNLRYTFGVEKLDVLMPYFWLGRQDKNPRTDGNPLIRERDKGRDVGYKWLLRDMKAHGADRLLTFNPHFHREPGTFEEERICIVALSGAQALARYANKLYNDGLISDGCIITGPDFGSGPLVKEFAKLVKRESKMLEKNRLDESTTEPRGNGIDAEGRDILLLDDIFSTLVTIENAAGSVRNPGYIDCFAVHPVLPMEGFERSKALKKRVRRFVGTDSIDSDYSRASVIPEVVEFYKSDA